MPPLNKTITSKSVLTKSHQIYIIIYLASSYLWLIVALSVAEFLNCYYLKALIKGKPINRKSLVLV